MVLYGQAPCAQERDKCIKYHVIKGQHLFDRQPCFLGRLLVDKEKVHVVRTCYVKITRNIGQWALDAQVYNNGRYKSA